MNRRILDLSARHRRCGRGPGAGPEARSRPPAGERAARRLGQQRGQFAGRATEGRQHQRAEQCADAANWLRSETNANIGNNNGRKTADKAQLDRIANDTKTTAPGSFEQHLADYFGGIPGAASPSRQKTTASNAPNCWRRCSGAMLDGDGRAGASESARRRLKLGEMQLSLAGSILSP